MGLRRGMRFFSFFMVVSFMDDVGLFYSLETDLVYPVRLHVDALHLCADIGEGRDVDDFLQWRSWLEAAGEGLREQTRDEEPFGILPACIPSEPGQQIDKHVLLRELDDGVSAHNEPMSRFVTTERRMFVGKKDGAHRAVWHNADRAISMAPIHHDMIEDEGVEAHAGDERACKGALECWMPWRFNRVRRFAIVWSVEKDVATVASGRFSIGQAAIFDIEADLVSWHVCLSVFRVRM